MTNLDITELVTSRRTIHHFKPEAVPVATLKTALESACFAPNHHLTEPWHFYLLEQETIKAICELNRTLLAQTKDSKMAQAKYERWLEIPGWLVVTCDRSEDQSRYLEDYAACCCVIQNLMLLLWARGIGTKWSTGAVTQEPLFYEHVWINHELEQVIGLVWYGYPAELPQTVRKPLQQVLTELP